MAMDQATPLDAAAVSTDAGQLIQQTPAAEPGLARPRAGQPLSGQSRPVSTQHVAARPAASAQHRPQPPTAGSSRQNGRPSSGDEERARLRLAGIIDDQ